MTKILWKPGNMLNPLPVVLITCGDFEGEHNVLTIAWTGIICTNPPLTYISVRPERFSYNLLKESGEFVINLPTAKICKAVDYCGVKSGRDEDKFITQKLTPLKADFVKAPLIQECPVNIECKVLEIKELGSHHMFTAEIMGVHVEDSYINENGAFAFHKTESICYAHGHYYQLGQQLGHFGFSVKKPVKKKKKHSTKRI